MTSTMACPSGSSRLFRTAIGRNILGHRDGFLVLFHEHHEKRLDSVPSATSLVCLIFCLEWTCDGVIAMNENELPVHGPQKLGQFLVEPGKFVFEGHTSILPPWPDGK